MTNWVSAGVPGRTLQLRMPNRTWRTYNGGTGVPLYMKQADGAWKLVTRAGQPGCGGSTTLEIPTPTLWYRADDAPTGSGTPNWPSHLGYGPTLTRHGDDVVMRVEGFGVSPQPSILFRVTSNVDPANFQADIPASALSGSGGVFVLASVASVGSVSQALFDARVNGLLTVSDATASAKALPTFPFLYANGSPDAYDAMFQSLSGAPADPYVFDHVRIGQWAIAGAETQVSVYEVLVYDAYSQPDSAGIVAIHTYFQQRYGLVWT